MKTLSIQQPWASLICAGIKDVENRTWKAAQVPGRILIHASSKKVPKTFENTIPLDWMIVFEQNQIFGNLPFYDDMPTSAIIGYGTVTAFKEKTDSIWDSGEDMIKWVFEDVYLFDNPIEDVKGKLGLFDYPLDENNLPPAHKVSLKYPELNDTTLSIPVNEYSIDRLLEGANELAFSLDDKVYNLLTDADGNLKEIQNIKFVSPTRTTVSDAEDVEISEQLDQQTNEPIVEKNVKGEDIEWLIFYTKMQNTHLVQQSIQ